MKVDEQTRQLFLKRLGNYYARVLIEARWIAFEFGGRNDEEDALQRRARDLVSEVAFRVVNEKRTWKPDVDFVVFMKLQMKSIASNEWKQARRHDSVDDEVENDDGSRVPKRQFAGDVDPVESALDEQEAEDRVYELLEAAEGDERLSKVIEAYLTDECEKPRHVAACLGIPEKDVYQAQRKLERRVTARRKKVNQ